ncbi:MAG: glycosyl transferase, group 1 [Candidatus Solibacter sp.]|jgi:glycosyltransferase involved in cell wall biosynthesis|nr:glycosyl transferase, group 1 [Candidatus Solibacter sp.]
MKTLWVNSNFMHPTTKGGQIRTLEMLRHLHRWHEIHYVAIENPALPEGPARAHEYSTKSYPFKYRVHDKTSPAFYTDLVRGLFSPVPVAVERFNPPGMRAFLEGLIRKERFDCAVVDHLAPTSYFPDLPHAVFFQHNVETVIWRRHVEHASDALRRRYFKLQADRMYHYERRVSQESGHIVAVSKKDADEMRRLFDVTRVSEIPTGVNIEYFLPPEPRPEPVADLVFVGSMDWLPNVDGVLYFAREILPLIRAKRPETTVAIVGRTPPPKLLQLGAEDSKIQITGTVPDIRPYLWGSAVSIVPLRIGGGTRLKIYEAMAAKIPVVSTTIGAEGLTVNPPDDIRIADTPAEFANQCLNLLFAGEVRERVATAAWEMVNANFSWEHVSRCFEKIMLAGPRMS